MSFGLSDLNPVHVKSAYDAGKDVVKGAGGLAEDASDFSTDVAGDAAQIVSEPVGYIEKNLANLSWDKVTGAVTFGLNDVAADLAREAGLGPLVDGVNSFAMWSAT